MNTRDQRCFCLGNAKNIPIPPPPPLPSPPFYFSLRQLLLKDYDMDAMTIRPMRKTFSAGMDYMTDVKSWLHIQVFCCFRVTRGGGFAGRYATPVARLASGVARRLLHCRGPRSSFEGPTQYRAPCLSLRRRCHHCAAVVVEPAHAEKILQFLRSVLLCRIRAGSERYCTARTVEASILLYERVRFA